MPRRRVSSVLNGMVFDEIGKTTIDQLGWAEESTLVGKYYMRSKRENDDLY
jgi:hypothetical protein